jgi:hypothetical protein
MSVKAHGRRRTTTAWGIGDIDKKLKILYFFLVGIRRNHSLFPRSLSADQSFSFELCLTRSRCLPADCSQWVMRYSVRIRSLQATSSVFPRLELKRSLLRLSIYPMAVSQLSVVIFASLQLLGSPILPLVNLTPQLVPPLSWCVRHEGMLPPIFRFITPDTYPLILHISL